jgi:hypothetical protein
MGGRHGQATRCTSRPSNKVHARIKQQGQAANHEQIKAYSISAARRLRVRSPPAVAPSSPRSQSGKERPHPRCSQPCRSRWASAQWTRDRSRVQTCICHPRPKLVSLCPVHVRCTCTRVSLVHYTCIRHVARRRRVQHVFVRACVMWRAADVSISTHALPFSAGTH